MHAGVLLSLTGNYEAGVKFVNLCFVIVYKLPDAPSLHASELYSRILELLFHILLAHKVAQLLEKQRVFNHRLQSSFRCITRLSVYCFSLYLYISTDFC